MVACISELTPHDLSVSNSLLTVLGIVLGLVIGFRTSSAYERYQEGRKLWADIAVASGNLGQIIWSYIPDVEILVDPASQGEPDAKKIRINKREVLRLIQAFSISVKQFICFEQRDDYERELRSMTPWLPGLGLTNKTGRRNTKSGSPSVESPPPTSGSPLYSPGVKSGQDLEKAEEIQVLDSQSTKGNSSKSPFSYFIYRTQRDQKEGQLGRSRKRHECERCPPRPILPLQISLSLHHYVNLLRISTPIPDSILGALVTNLDSFQQAVNNLERIRTTPIPFAYQIHLKFSLWLYLAFLPFQVVDQMKWATIPGTLFASLLLLGFHAIGQQIENPFNGDANDLDMDYFCDCIKAELEEIVTNPAPAAFINQFCKSTIGEADSTWNDTKKLTLVSVGKVRKPAFREVPQFDEHGSNST